MSVQDLRKNAKYEIKGRNPHFFEDPNTDRLLTMVMELASEVSVLRDRLDTHERVASEKSLYTEDDIESYKPTEDVAAARSKWRSNFLDRLLKGLYAKYNDSPSDAA